jgi:hypothetical protein
MLDIKLSGLSKTKAKLTPKLVREPAGRMIRNAATFAQREARAGLRDSSSVARSIAAEVHDLEAKVRGSGAALAVEFGRHPGTPPPPASALRSWAATHGVEDFIYPIAQAISRRGIKGRFFMRAARQKLQSQELPRLTNQAKREIETEWAR